mmetsp:Transcript_21285/g.52444  ORF Transcript_21285/g.52444 Transcript_21285/m.52444 type:complete len:253 (+) Transcript_21285:2389-3147(+)
MDLLDSNRFSPSFVGRSSLFTGFLVVFGSDPARILSKTCSGIPPDIGTHDLFRAMCDQTTIPQASFDIALHFFNVRKLNERSTDFRHKKTKSTDTIAQQIMIEDNKVDFRATYMIRQQSSVRFSRNEVFVIPSLDEYSEQEIQDCWISTEEKRKMFDQQFKVIRKMEQGIGKKSSFRGLENHTRKGEIESERRRLKCIDLVMDEQDIQIDKDIYDSEKLCKLSKKASKKSKTLARKQAKKDAAAARKYLESP